MWRYGDVGVTPSLARPSLQHNIQSGWSSQGGGGAGSEFHKYKISKVFLCVPPALRLNGLC